MSVIPVIFLVLLLTFNTSIISINNSAAAEFYDNSLGSPLDILCNEDKISETSQNGQGKIGNLDDDGNPLTDGKGSASSSSDGKGSASSDVKPSGKTGKVITPPPTTAGPNKIANINDDSTDSTGGKGSASSSSDGKGSASSSAGTKAIASSSSDGKGSASSSSDGKGSASSSSDGKGSASSSSDGKGSASSDVKPSGKTGKVITPPPTTAGPNKIANINDDDSKTQNTLKYLNCSNTEESNGIDNSITDNHLETHEPGINSISCGQVIDESVVLTSNLDCKGDGLLVVAKTS